jgi:hypothetical protein
MFTPPALQLFINALPLVARGFFNFFFLMLTFPLFVTESSSLTVTETVESSPGPLPAVAGPLQDLVANSIPFSIAVDIGTTTQGSFELFDQDGLTHIASGRASCAISGTLTVAVILKPASTLTVPVIMFSGACAIIPANHNPAKPSVQFVAQLPGSTVLNGSMLGCPPAVLSIPPGIQTDVMINQVIGKNPRFIYSYDGFNVGGAVITISGRAVLSGLGYPAGFF